MNNNKRTLLQRLIIGLKVGWSASVLPDRVINIHNHPFVRIFRVIGGLSILAVLSDKYLLFVFPFNIFVLFIALLHFIYITVISIVKLFYGIGVLRSDKLNVKNSPFDHFATTAGKLLYCWKMGCQVGSAGLGLVGTSFMIDSILEAGNQEKVFTPLIGKGVKLIVNGRPADDILSGINKDIKNLEESKKRYKEISDLFNKADAALDQKEFKKEEIDSIKSTIDEIKKMERSKITDYSSDLAKKIREYSNINK